MSFTEDTALASGEPPFIGPYQVTRLLERKGLYRQYLVRRQGDPVEYCLRTLLFADIADEDTMERYRRECEVLTRLRHPNLPELIDWGFWQHASAYFVTPVLAGRQLSDVLAADAPLPWSAVQPLVRQMLEGLAVLHEAGMVHRNLTPDGVHVGTDGTVRILDFSLISLQAMQPLTLTGTTLGDSNYVAPEQLVDAKRADARADLYSVGAIAYELLSGHLPRDGWTADQLTARLPRDPGRPLPEVAPGLTPPVYDWVAALIRPARQERPPTAQAALSMLPPPTG
jgi:serine/threonine-protein kinase